jgi:hypothetical protein
MRRTAQIVALIITLIITQTVLAQDDAEPEMVTVPDVTGLSLPQAIALLNREGLGTGELIFTGRIAEDEVPVDTVSAQSIAPGEVVPFGTLVDVTVLRAPNALLIYDDNDITLVNRTEGSVDLRAIEFNSLDGSTGTSFVGSRWESSVGDGNCVQLWSIGARAAKSLPECGATRWLTTNNPEEHFWTGANGATQFQIVQGGVQRAVCPVSHDGRCEFYLQTGLPRSEIAEYVYMAYTTDKFSIINQSEDELMPLGALVVTGSRGERLSVASRDEHTPLIPTNTQRPAPGQCLLMTNRAADNTPPQRCDVIAERAFDADYVFWQQAFTVTSVTDGEDRTCPGAVEGRLTLCILPR